MENATKISAVLFDYGMVLCETPATEDWQRLESVLGAEPKAFEALYWKYRNAYDRGALNAETYWEVVARELDKPLDASTLRALKDADIAAWTRPNAEMMDWAARLHRTGIKTGILSNIGDAMELGIREKFPFLEEFSHHTFSHRLGIAKPDVAIYQHAVEGLGGVANEILFVDDREENIRGARMVGMVGVVYSSHGEFVGEMERRGLGWLLML